MTTSGDDPVLPKADVERSARDREDLERELSFSHPLTGESAGGADLGRQLEELEASHRFPGPAEVVAPGAFGSEPLEVPLKDRPGGRVIGTATVFPDGSVVAEVDEVEELRPGVARLEEVPADAVKALDVGFGSDGTASFWHRPGGELVIRPLDGSLVELDPKVLLP